MGTKRESWRATASSLLDGDIEPDDRQPILENLAEAACKFRWNDGLDPRSLVPVWLKAVSAYLSGNAEPHHQAALLGLFYAALAADLPCGFAASLEQLIQYNWTDEAEDYRAADTGRRIGHIFRELVVLRNFATGDTRSPEQYIGERRARKQVTAN